MYSPGTYYMSNPIIGLGVSGQNKTPYVFIEGEITHDASSAELSDQSKRTIYMYLSDAAFPYTADKLDRLGWNGDFKSPALTGDAVAGLWVECRHEQYNGSPREKWEIPGGSMEHSAPEADVIRKINAMYKQRQSALRKHQPPPRHKAAEPKKVSADDPIPFDGK